MPITLDSDGYFRTGDLGYFAENEKDLLVIKGRNRDVIKKGGYLIFLREMEVFVETNTLVEQAAAVKVKHDFFGESYNLYIIFDNSATSVSGVLDKFEVWIHENLARSKWPNAIIVRSEFPRTLTGKVKKSELLG